jgi:hypothetical protein
MSEIDSESDSVSHIMSVDSTSLLIESLEAQVDDLMMNNYTLTKQIEYLEDRIKMFQRISNSDIINKVFLYM